MNKPTLTPTKLRAIRRRLKLNQQQFAAQLGLRRYQTVLEYENGRRPIPQQVVLICQLKKWV